MTSKLLKAAPLLLLAICFLAVGDVAYAQQVYDFASSTSEANALVVPLRNAAFTIVFGSIAVLIVASLAFMGAGWVWGRFKKFTGIRRKI